jgi:predicted lipid-binding transport protein (Tim44 family)
MQARRVVPLLALCTLALLAAEATDSWARAARGGSRGSRSFSAPVRPAPTMPSTPATPRRAPDQPAAPSPGPRPGVFGGFGGMLTGLLVGGLLGGLLFGGLGHGVGIGLLDILLVGGGIVLLMSVLRRRRQPEHAYAGRVPAGFRVPAEAGVEPPDLDRGLGHIRAMDAGFDAGAVGSMARAAFLDVQGAIAARDLTPIRARLTPEMHADLQAQCDRLRAARHTNRMEQIRVERAEVTEGWQESGWDFVTVMLGGSMLDYVVSDTGGTVVDGSSTAPATFEEFWTFTRPVGPNAWKLAAIQTG